MCTIRRSLNALILLWLSLNALSSATPLNLKKPEERSDIPISNAAPENSETDHDVGPSRSPPNNQKLPPFHTNWHHQSGSQDNSINGQMSGQISYNTQIGIGGASFTMSYQYRQKEMERQSTRIRQITSELHELKQQMELLEKRIRELESQNLPTNKELLQELAQCRARWRLHNIEMDRLYGSHLEYQRQILDEEERNTFNDISRQRDLREKRTHWQRLWESYQRRKLYLTKELENYSKVDSKLTKSTNNLTTYTPNATLTTSISNNNIPTLLTTVNQVNPNVGWGTRPNPTPGRTLDTGITENNVSHGFNFTSNRQNLTHDYKVSWTLEANCEEREQVEKYKEREDRQYIEEQIRTLQAHHRLLKIQQQRQFEESKKLYQAREEQFMKQNKDKECDHNHECDCSEVTSPASTSSTSSSIASSTVYGTAFKENLEPVKKL